MFRKQETRSMEGLAELAVECLDGGGCSGTSHAQWLVPTRWQRRRRRTAWHAAGVRIDSQCIRAWSLEAHRRLLLDGHARRATAPSSPAISTVQPCAASGTYAQLNLLECWIRE
ncbi:hypothetical protein L1887_48584 [Cichorium endivia]|nr:hypothetical protein L1887_48584 [Cichorium endivia]